MAETFSIYKREPTVLRYAIRRSAFHELQSAGARLQPIPQGGLRYTIGQEFYIPPMAPGLFNSPKRWRSNFDLSAYCSMRGVMEENRAIELIRRRRDILLCDEVGVPLAITLALVKTALHQGVAPRGRQP